MACNNNGSTYGSAWFRLTPDIHGSYLNGTWSSLASMHDTRLYFSSQVLKDGRVFVAGGEYGTGGATAEVYDPTTNLWTHVNPPTSLLDPSQPSGVISGNQSFLDSGSEILADGSVLIAPVGGKVSGQPLIYNPTSNTWSAGPNYVRGAYQDEASWVKLPDNSILTIDPFGTNSERYIPSSNAWVNDGVVPASLYDSFGFELGGALLLPSGKALYLGSTGHTALYTPTGTTSPGTWVAGPDIPGSKGTPDAPCAMLVTGNVLCAVSPVPTNGNHFPSPTTFYEYDPVANAFTSVAAPVGSSDNRPTFQEQMLALPDGSVLYSHMASDIYDYAPTGSPLAAGKPVVTGVTINADGSFHLTGTGLNGISEGASYGDDAQMNTNYPIVRLVSGTNVYYARTYNWTSTGVATGATPVATELRPSGGTPSGAYSLYVIANGIASDPFAFNTSMVGLTGTGANTIADNVGNGNGNGRIDPGETAIQLTVPARNNGNIAATGVTATLVSNTPTVTVATATSGYPNLSAAGGTGSNATPFVLNVSAAHPCGGLISLTLTLNSAQGSGTYNFSLPTGQSGGTGGPFTVSYTGPAVPIPDNNAAGATATLSVSGLTGTISDLNFRFDGSSCTNAAGATTVGLDHTYVGDLTITLQSPTGTVVTLISRPTGGAGSASGNNFCSTVLDDSASTSIQTIGTTGDPYSGTWAPFSPLSAFNGLNPNGNWLLKAVDSVATDTGSIRAFSLVFTTSTPATCDPPLGGCTPASVAGNPSSQTVCSGSNASFTVTGAGTAPLTYQWRKGGANISGANGATYAIAPATSADAGSYDCVVNNACGGSGAASTAVTLTVNAAPAVTGSPTALTRCVGTSASFTAAGTGTPAPTFQWRKGGVNIGGANSPTYTIGSVSTADADSYDCVLTNSCGTIGTGSASLTVNTSPSVTTSPSSRTVCEGASASFTAAGTGTPAPTYQWRKGGVVIGSAASPTYTIGSVSTGDAGSYDCVLTNSCGTVSTSSATLTVNTAPTFTTPPAPQATCAGTMVTLSAVADGTPVPSYQWRKGGQPISGANASSYTILSPTANDTGSYDCVATNSCGSATSSPAALSVDGGPTITQQPASIAICATNDATFSAAGTGAGQVSYRWQWLRTGQEQWLDITPGQNSDGAAFFQSVGGLASSLSVTDYHEGGINPGGAHKAAVRCILTDDCGPQTSDPATLTINSADFNGDGDLGTDTDIAAFFDCLAGDCCPTCGTADFNGDGDLGTDTDIEAFFRVLGGGPC
jgi:subtilisin-like proprotein convertase family protein